MRQWSALLIKDFKLSRTVFFIGLVINVLMALLTLYLGRVAGDTLLMFVPLAIVVALHAVYVPIVVFFSLKRESNHLLLWLSNPQPAAKLLMSKIANGMMMIVISLVMLYALSGALIIPNFDLIEPYWTDAWKLATFVFVHIIWISIAICAWMMGLWASYQYLRLKLGRWSRAAVAAAAILSGGIFAWFTSSAPYRSITEWGSITYKLPVIFKDPLQTYVGEYLFDVVIIAGLFILTAWLVDNKVEV